MDNFHVNFVKYYYFNFKLFDFNFKHDVNFK